MIRLLAAGLAAASSVSAMPARALDVTGPQLAEFYLIQLAVNQCPDLGFPQDKTDKLAQVVHVLEQGSSFSDAQMLDIRVQARNLMDKEPAKICSDVKGSIPKVVQDLK